jgi:hypothetical protein
MFEPGSGSRRTGLVRPVRFLAVELHEGSNGATVLQDRRRIGGVQVAVNCGTGQEQNLLAYGQQT